MNIIKRYISFRVVNTSGGSGVWGLITGTLSDQTDLQAALDLKADKHITYDTVDMSAVSNYTAVQGDNNKGKLLSKATAITFTLPPLESGTQFIVRRTGSGEITFVASGVTITNTKGDLTDPGQNLAVFVSYKSTTEVYLDNGVQVSGGTGDVVGPASAVDNNFAAFNLATGKVIKDSGYNSSSFDAAGAAAAAASASVPTSRTLNGMALSANRVIPEQGIYRKSGLYYSILQGDTSAGVVQVADSLKAWPIYVRKDYTFSAMIAEVTNLQALASFRLGIYNDDGTGFYPGSLIPGSDTGALDATANGVKTSTLGTNITLTGGNIYWLAMNHSHAASVRCWAAARSPQHFGINNAATLAPFICLAVSLSYGALPSTFTVGATAITTATTSSAPPVVGALIV